MATMCCGSYHGCCLSGAPVPAGSARLRGDTVQALLCAMGVADSGPNSGASDALGHSGTGVVGGVEEVLVVVVVVVVRSRYH